MKNDSLYYIIFFIGVPLLIVAVFLYFSPSPAEKPLNIPSQCYTNLQASNYFNSPSETYVTIDSNKSIVMLPFLSNRTIFDYQLTNSGSMRPAIPDNSIILLVKPLNEYDIKVGDIITYQHNPYPMTHRVINISILNNQTIYLTKGDNNDDNDLNIFNITVKFKDIIGKVVSVIY